MKAIKLDNNTYVHVYVHRVPVSLEEAVISSETGSFPNYEQLANQYIDALEDHWCVAFLEKLHEVCAQRIIEHWEEFSPDQLKEKHCEQYLKFKK
jgi:hemerythrin-like domain-containing protein